MHSVVFESSSLRILDYRCETHEPGLSPEEEAHDHEVVLPRRGLFVHHVAGESFVGDSSGALFFNRGDCYRVSHPAGGGDHCTALAFSRSRITDCLAAVDPSWDEVEESLFPRRRCATTPAVDLLHRRLLRAIHESSDDLHVDEIGLDLLGWLIGTSLDRTGRARVAARRSATCRDHDELVQGTQAELARRLGEKLQLNSLARAVSSSPFHLSRVFRARTGSSISEYHRRLRLRAALERILDGEEDLMRLALELGFSHHSHFTNAFRREFGVTPSAGRDRVSLAALRMTASGLASRSQSG